MLLRDSTLSGANLGFDCIAVSFLAHQAPSSLKAVAVKLGALSLLIGRKTLLISDKDLMVYSYGEQRKTI